MVKTAVEFGRLKSFQGFLLTKPTVCLSHLHQQPMEDIMAEAMTLKDLCEELKLDPRMTRMKLREAVKNNPDLAAIHKPRTQWRWLKGTAEDKSIRKAVV